MIEVNLFNIVGVSVLGVMIASWYSPIQSAKRSFIGLFSSIRIIHSTLDKALSCGKCTSFLLSLFFFLDLPTAALCAFIGFIISHIIDRVNVWYE